MGRPAARRTAATSVGATRVGATGLGAPRLGATGLVAGLLLTAALPPFGWWPLALVGAALLVGLLRHRTLWGRVGVGVSAGLGLFGPGLWWITEFSAPGYVASAVLEAAILGAAMAAVPPRRGRLVSFPAALVVAEAVHDHWPFGGVPLAGVALGQAGGPLAPAARLGGHLLLVALVGMAGAGLAALAEGFLRARAVRNSAIRAPDRGEGRLAGSARAGAGVAALAAVAALAMLGAVAPRGTAVGRLRVAAVQGGGARGLRAVFTDREIAFRAQLAASERVRTPVDLVVWPEDVVHVDGPLAGSPEEAAIAGLARRLGATVVAGVVEDLPSGRFRNAAVAWAPDGSVVARYEKVHRVPFGEYVPFRGLVSHVADLSAVPRDAVAGRGPGLLRSPAGRLGTMISYEVFFADRARAAVRAGAGVLLVPTNASSYTTAQVPTQEVAAARLRALETGRTVVQAAPTGFSAVVDPGGAVRARSDLGPAAVVTRTVTTRRGQTVATRLGDGPPTGASVMVVASAAALAYRRTQKT